MSIEQDTFFHYLIQPEKLPFYGFEPDGKTLVYEKMLPEENFKICLRFDGDIMGNILDLSTGEEYTNFRVESSTGFGAEVRQKFTALLEDIRDKCCRNQYFRSEQGRRINDYIFEKYHSVPEFLWPNIPSYAAFRRSGSKKWFAVIGSVPRRKVDPASSSNREVEVINVKVDSAEIKEILSIGGYYPAFHMNKKCWVSIILDDTLSDEEIQERVSDSFHNI